MHSQLHSATIIGLLWLKRSMYMYKMYVYIGRNQTFFIVFVSVLDCPRVCLSDWSALVSLPSGEKWPVYWCSGKIGFNIIAIHLHVRCTCTCTCTCTCIHVYTCMHTIWHYSMCTCTCTCSLPKCYCGPCVYTCISISFNLPLPPLQAGGTVSYAPCSLWVSIQHFLRWDSTECCVSIWASTPGRGVPVAMSGEANVLLVYVRSGGDLIKWHLLP